MSKKCERCGSDKSVITHHTKYIEIHGIDEVIMLCQSCHKFLHTKLRREGKCNIPPEIIQIYSHRACAVSDGRKEYMRTRNKNLYKNNTAYKKYVKEYEQKNKRKITFNTPADIGIMLREMITYNNLTGIVSISTWFSSNNKIIYKECV